ncbi:MAG: two component transcriptional regulator, winged helix family [Dehalococcoidia bacterium]|nr:two component transcriptional regulator, winged helix family [Dehalococcoidia bacterium]
MTSPKILVVDDEASLALLLKEWLEEEGYQVYCAMDGSEALKLFFQHQPTLSVVDLLMPGVDGFQLITRIREMSDSYILVLTGLGNDEYVIRGLNLGADEYLVKPVLRRAFLARVRALLRRAVSTHEAPSGYSDASLSLDFLTREVRVREQSRHLRPTEFRLLSYLCLNRHRVVGHQALLDHVWGEGVGSLDSLKWYIHSLRMKLEENPGTPRLITTVPGVGYRYYPQSHSESG